MSHWKNDEIVNFVPPRPRGDCNLIEELAVGRTVVAVVVVLGTRKTLSGCGNPCEAARKKNLLQNRPLFVTQARQPRPASVAFDCERI